MRKILISILTVMSVSACGYLDFDETNGNQQKEDIYRYFDKTKQVLTNIYSYVPQDFGSLDGAMRDCGCDDAVWGNPASAIQRFTDGSWSAVNTYDTGFGYYEGIRSANEFLESVSKTDFSRFQTDPNYDNWMNQIQYFSYEARALRAMMFFELAKRYGDIPMPLTVLSIEEANTIHKTPFDDIISFIASECDECAAKLPQSYVDEPYAEFGRVTKGFCMALKTKALLYAASPLHNPSGNKAKWKKAAEAALDLIETGWYELDRNDKCNNLDSKENIFIRINSQSNSFENVTYPLRFMFGQRSNVLNCIYPTQNLVDAFQTVNGYKVTLHNTGFVSDDPKFDPSKPYANRDPRLAKVIAYNGSVFVTSTIETFEGGKDAATVQEGGTPTGYYLRKYVQERTSFDPSSKASYKHHWVVFRYAEILLSYAEAMVEAFDNPDYTDEEFPYSASWALDKVRANAGMPKVIAKVKRLFVEEVRNEWRVEFAFEDHRFWDVRRWNIGAETQRDIYGVTIRKNGEALTYTQKISATRKWHSKMNLYPIPQSELLKNNNLNPQNKGW